MNDFVQGRPEDPRDTPQVQNDIFVVTVERFRGGGDKPGICYREPAIHRPTKSIQRSEGRLSKSIDIDDYCNRQEKKGQDDVPDIVDRVPGSPHFRPQFMEKP